eukprot:CAMPEP_0170507530 /NCGR_PEP_ID=MMETSP0208-20121228/59147_1 /TAXON_ID=197538 /ORGANISM="Strombidium inclinatum, Strain S3" /LENGTH=55 /DNA_ID=CAMNT_0010789773 /DNA_START=1408 /DNA_END=1575 /DNA_ORIENTATION=-
MQVDDGSNEEYDEEVPQGSDRPAPVGNFSQKTVPLKEKKRKKKKAKGVRQLPTQV